jgi:soluble P-type ATPase
VAITVDIPGRQRLELDYLLLDQNGTLSKRGELLPGVKERLGTLGAQLSVHILSGDSFGTLGQIADELGGVDARTVQTGAEKKAFADQLGGDRCASIGNGFNDVEMFKACAVSIAVIGPEGASHAAIAAQILCSSITDALDLLIDPRMLAATLKA